MSAANDQGSGAPLRRWGFIGSGKMATAMIRGMIRDGTPPDSISASDPDPPRPGPRARGRHGGCHLRRRTPTWYRTGATSSSSRSSRRSMAGLLAEIRPIVTVDHLVVSVAAGVSLATMAKGLGPDRRLVRVMPNTPALVGEGASAYCLGPAARPEDDAVVVACLEAIGKAFRVPEQPARRRHRALGERAGVRLRHDRGPRRRRGPRRASLATSAQRPSRRRPSSARPGNGPRDRPASRLPEGPGHQPRPARPSPGSTP